MARRSIVTCLAALALCALLGACATVAPWDRERLASPDMKMDPDALGTEIDEHTHEYREAAAGGFGGAGGGCGCN